MHVIHANSLVDCLSAKVIHASSGVETVQLYISDTLRHKKHKNLKMALGGVVYKQDCQRQSLKKNLVLP